MTTSNIIDVSRQNGQTGHDHAMAQDHEKTPEEIQLEIARTRSAITEDLLALSEKLSPQHLRESAREVLRDAREEAKEVLREAKDAAIGSLRDMKDRAMGTVSEKVSLVGQQAKRASDLTVSFASANAVALSLVGLGTGFLLMLLRNRRARLRGEQYAYHYEDYDYPPSERARVPGTGRGLGSRASQLVDRAREQVHSATNHASELAGDAREHAHELVDEARSRARQVGRSAGELGRRTQRGARQLAGRSREVAVDNRVAVIAVTIAAGLGLGLLLPAGRRPRQALLQAGERLWGGAQDLGRQLGARSRRIPAEYDPAYGSRRF